MYLLLISIFLFCEAALSAEIVNLNEENMDYFVKNNKYAVALFCNATSVSVTCPEKKVQLLTAADKLNEEKRHIMVGKMALGIKNLDKWIGDKIEGTNEGDIFVFFCHGRYTKFFGGAAEDIKLIVKDCQEKCVEDPKYFPNRYEGSSGLAVIVDLNRKNIKDFVKNNKHAVAFFCDFDKNIFCEDRKYHFLTAADGLMMSSSPIKFGIMDHIKNEWIKKKITFPIKGDTFVFFCQGRYTKLWGGSKENMFTTINHYRITCEEKPTGKKYFYWEYME